MVATVVGGIESAFAAPDVKVNDILKFSDGPGNGNGGEFKVQVVAPVAGPVDQFRTFCVQTNEFINFSDTFEVVAISDTSQVAGSSKLKDETAFLYTMFRAGTLAGYDYVNAGQRDLDADTLQAAIWGYEGEGFLDPNNEFVILANAAVAVNGVWYGKGIGDVRIANMVYATGSKDFAQDVLVLVPEPASVLDWSLIGGCFVVGHRIRRSRMIVA